MCEKCEKKREAFRSAGLDLQRKVVGVVPQDLVDELLKNDKLQKATDKDLDAYMYYLMAEAQSDNKDLESSEVKHEIEVAVNEKYGPILSRINKTGLDIMNNVYKALGLDPQENYEAYLDTDTRELTIEVVSPLQGAK